VSRVGKQPISITPGVTVKDKDREIEVIGPKGSLRMAYRREIKIEIKDNQILVNRLNDSKISRSLHGLTRTLIANMVKGVTEGFSKTLKVVGTGYKVVAEGKDLVLSVGFSHPVNVKQPEGISFEVEGNNIIKVSGINKGLVGQWAAKIRDIYPPEAYKGKGIRYLDEEVRRKPGKAGKAVGAVGGGK